MFIDLNEVTLEEDVFSYIGRTSASKVFQENIKKEIMMINRLLNSNLEKLSNRDFYNLISEFYDVTLEEDDYLDIISKMYNKKFTKFVEIGTYMTFEDIKSEKYGRKSDWWRQLYQIKYIVVVSEDIDIKPDSIFKKADIKKLIKNNKIVIIERKTVAINEKLKYNEKPVAFPMTKFNCSYSDDGMYGNIEDNEYFPVIISILRKKFTKEKIIIDMKNYLRDLQLQINTILSSNLDNSFHTDTSHTFSNWFNNSKEKEQIKRLSKQVNKTM